LTPEHLHPLSPARYWDERAARYAHRSGGLGAVCSYGMPLWYNVAIDLCQRRALAPWIRGRGTGTVLDVGCGVGRWSLRLAARGMTVTGVDHSECMVKHAAERAELEGLTCTFVRADANHLRLDRRFDLILSVTVLQHIVDADQAARAIRNLAAHLAPNGELVLLEAAPSRMTERCDSGVFRARSFDWYHSALAQAGLRVVYVRGVDPLPFRTALLPYYKRMPKPLVTLLSALVAAVSLPFDWLLAPYLSEASWHKVIVARPCSEQSR
jgi:2-polyprenyl-3-methyl-5-hydroxy-6-metoxy-1,4-benzoquinol methylase